jgi:hypothetical protein
MFTRIRQAWSTLRRPTTTIVFQVDDVIANPAAIDALTRAIRRELNRQAMRNGGATIV